PRHVAHAIDPHHVLRGEGRIGHVRCSAERKYEFFFFKQKTAYEIGLGIPAEPLFRSRLRSLRLLRVSGIVMRLRMFLLLNTFLKASHSFRNRLLVICKNAYLFATMIMTSVSSPFSCCSGIVRLNLM